MRPLRIFIGYDHAEIVAYHVLSHSILRHSSVPVSITPVALPSLKSIFNRERDPMQSNDFAFTRWLVPYLSGYRGLSLFMDCDMLVMDDIAELFDLYEPGKAVHVVKHNHEPVESVKYLGTKQTRYGRKNWSSVMLFNTYRCRILTPDYIKRAPGLDLHQFRWIDDGYIGDLPQEWNHLVGYTDIDIQPSGYKVKNAHYTTGGPYFDEYRDVEFAEEWLAEYNLMNYCKQMKG